MSLIWPVESNTPLQPPPAWPSPVGTSTFVTAAAMLAGDEIKPYSVNGPIIPAGTVATATADIFTDVSVEPSLVVLVKVTAVSGGTVTVQINGKTSDGEIYPILTSTALGAVAVTPLRVGSGFTPVANLTANDLLPSDMQVVCTVAGTITYGVEVIIG
jgi:hypothetical protein